MTADLTPTDIIAEHGFDNWWQVSKPAGTRVGCSCGWVGESDGWFTPDEEAEADARKIHAVHVVERLVQAGHTIVPAVEPPLPRGTIGYWPVWMVKVDEAFKEAGHQAGQRLMDQMQAEIAAAASATTSAGQ